MIRTLNHNDLDDFLKIRMDSLRLNPEAFGASFSEKPDRKKTYNDLKAKNEENFILGYYEDNQILGIVGFMRHHRVKMRHKGFIWGMFVYPEQRGKGIGKALMRDCLRRTEQIVGLEKVNLSVIVVQERALGLYRQLGFEEYGREANAQKVIGRSYEEVYMSKSLY